MFPLAKLALESHALGDLKRRDEAALDLRASHPFAGCHVQTLAHDFWRFVVCRDRDECWLCAA